MNQMFKEYEYYCLIYFNVHQLISNNNFDIERYNVLKVIHTSLRHNGLLKKEVVKCACDTSDYL